MTSSARIQRMLEWFNSNQGHFHPDIEIVHDATHGVHARAREHVAPTDGKVTVCSCPLPLSLSGLNVPGIKHTLDPGSYEVVHEAGPISGTLARHVDPAIVSRFVLMEQRLLGEQSFWHPYIDILPTEAELTTPLYFDGGDLEWLLGTNMHVGPGKSAVEDRRNARAQEWESAMAALQLHDREGRELYTLDLYLWAATIFTSRAFSFSAAFGQPGDAFSILYPGVDFLNHSPRAKVAWDFQRGNFTLRTTQALEEGAEVYNNYAPKGNEELLMGYGFAVQDNPADTVRIVLPQPPDHVHRHLKSALPDHFKSRAWNAEEASFQLRGSSHYAGPYAHGVACLRGVPYAMFRMMAELVYFMSTGDDDGAEAALQDDDFFSFVIEHFLGPLRVKRAAIPAIERKPGNEKQRYAQIYRNGQIKILDEVIAELEQSLQTARP